MRNVSKAFRRTLFENKRNWLPRVDITLADGTVLPQFTEETLWTSGLSFETVVSEDESFTALGAAIMGVSTVVIDNTGEQWNEYDFNDADVTVRVGLDVDGSLELIRIGQYTVESANYNGATVTLTLNDYMHQFDRAYDTALAYPATLGAILRDACTSCGVLYDNSLLSFPNNEYTVSTKPSAENTSYRDVVAWVAQLAGCFAKFNATGKLEFKWFGDDILIAAQEGYDGGEFDPESPYATGDSANGGTFNPWNIGAELEGGALTDNGNCHYIGSLFTETIALDDTVITGVAVSAEREVDNSRETVTGTAGTSGYVIGVEGNKLLSADDVNTFATYLGSRVIGLTFRKCRATHLSDPSIEAGDVALLYDHKGKEYPILITRTRFTAGGRQETVCGSATPARNRAKQFAQETKNYVDLKRQLKQTQTAWDLAEANLRRQLQTASGLFKTEVEEPAGSGAYKTYYHDKANLEDSNIVMLFTDYGFTLTSDYQNGANATWYGIGADGTGILDVLDTHGIDAEWIITGTIADQRGYNSWNLRTGEFRLADGAKVGTGNATVGDLVTSCVVEYALTTTSTAPSDNASAWSATASWVKGKYLWSRTKTTYQNGTSETTNPELIVDQYGNSAQVTSVVTEWIQTTTNTAPAANNGSWSTAQPTWVYGRYIWTRTKVTYADGTTQTSAAVLANSLTKSSEDTWKELTDNGQIQGLFRVLNSSTNKYELHMNAEYIGAGVLRSNDTGTNAPNFRLDLATGQMTMKKGSINLGSYTENGTSKYHFTVDDNGNLNANRATIKGNITADSLTLGSGVTIPYGSVSGTPDLTEYIKEDGTIGSLPSSGATDTSLTGFKVSSSGLLKAANAIIYGTVYSSAGRIGGWTLASNKITKGTLGSANSYHMVADGDSGSATIAGSGSKSNWCLGIGSNFGVDKTGSLYATGANISGTVKTVGGNYETTLSNGWIYFKKNNANIGKIGAAIVGGENAFNINMMTGARSVGIYDGDGDYATELMSYTKSDSKWRFNGAVNVGGDITGNQYHAVSNNTIYDGSTLSTVDTVYLLAEPPENASYWAVSVVNGIIC